MDLYKTLQINQKDGDFTMFQLTFKKLKQEHLDLILEWRNSEFVRLNMQYQNKISKENHYSWFFSLDLTKNFYHVLYEHDLPVGLFNIKDADFKKKTGEAGSFIGDKKFWGTGIAARAFYAHAIYAFNYLELENLYISVLKNNTNALRFNSKLGYTLLEEQSSDISLRFIMNYEIFFSNKFNVKSLKYLTNNY